MTVAMTTEMPAGRPIDRHLLDPYTTSHPLRSPSPLPPSSRVDPKLTQRLPPASSNPLFWTIPTWIEFIRFAFVKGLHIIWSLLSHFLWGPARKSWGYRMTLITSVMRNVADHTSLADIILIRRLISLHILVPLPADAVVTPITFVVPKMSADRPSKGFLRDLDAAETGTRELSGEWVVGTDVWKRLKAERRARRRAQRSALSVTDSTGDFASSSSTTAADPSRITDSPGFNHESSPAANESGSTPGDKKKKEKKKEKSSTSETERVIYYIHGGAYYVGNAATHRLITIGVSKACNARVFAITYRLAPEHTFPLPLQDVLHGYLRLLAPPLSIPPENIIVAGDSAGGGLSLALCMYLRDEGYQMPAGLILMSPWVDLTMSCGSWDENLAWDVVPRPEADDHLNPVGCYLGPKGIAAFLTHPYASPLFGDLHDLPPMLIQSGDSEVLRDEVTLLAHKATLSGVDVTHELYEDMVHVFQMFTFLPATKAAIANVGRWVRTTLPAIERQRLARIAEKEQGEAAPTGDDDVTRGIEERLDDELSLGSQVVEGDHKVAVGAPEKSPIQALWKTHSRVPSSSNRSFAPSPDSSSSAAAPDIDLDSLDSLDAETDTRSGSPTPTGSPSVEQDDPFLSSPAPKSAPRLRRALTAFAISPSKSTELSSGVSNSNLSPSQPNVARQRRRTQGASSLHHSPTEGISSPLLGFGAPHPSSPTPSVRRRLRSATINSPYPPSARLRSQSHSDIFQLVEGYVEGGAANETTVFSPGGEIRSVGVLGDDDV